MATYTIGFIKPEAKRVIRKLLGQDKKELSSTRVNRVATSKKIKKTYLGRKKQHDGMIDKIQEQKEVGYRKM